MIADLRAEKLRRKYALLQAWGELVGSGQYFLDEVIEQAEQQRVSVDAIYWGPDGPEEARWHTADEIVDRSRKDWIFKRAAQIKDDLQPQDR